VRSTSTIIGDRPRFSVLYVPDSRGQTTLFLELYDAGTQSAEKRARTPSKPSEEPLLPARNDLRNPAFAYARRPLAVPGIAAIFPRKSRRVRRDNPS
jgi:hypothetical protein